MINKVNLLTIIEITKNLKVLYVEDNKESREQGLKMLSNYFLHIDVAIDGKNALQKYKNEFLDTNLHYDLIISDIEMPNMNGIEMSEAIYNINSKQKIIIISAYDDKKYLIDLINLGVDGFIHKPLSFEQVSSALSQISQSFKSDSIINLTKSSTYNKLSKELYCNDKKISITTNENKFIEYLIFNSKSTNRLEDIFNYIFYDDPQKEFTSDSIKGLVKRLRKKIPDDLISYNRTNGYFINF